MKREIIVIFVMALLIFTVFNFPCIAHDNLNNVDKLKLIRNAINQSDAKWSAGFNTIFTSDEDNNYEYLGYYEEPIKNDDHDIVEHSVDLPNYIDWRNINGKNYITSVKDQGSCGSCTAFATLGALEAVLQIEYDEIFDCDLSEAHLFFCGGGICENGLAIRFATDFIKNMGVVDERCFPYKSMQMDCDEKAFNWYQRLATVENTGVVDGISDVKEALIEYGPVITTYIIYEDFLSYVGGIYEHVWGSKVYYHTVTIIGYNDDPGYWICKNSWGVGWGEDGFFRIKYGECEIDKDVYYVDGISGNIQPFKPRNVYPTDGSSDINVDLDISWESGDLNDDVVIFFVYFNEGIFVNYNNEPLAEGITNEFVHVKDLKKNISYSFQIIAEDEHGSQHISDPVTFTTRLPLKPIIQGPTDVKIRTEYKYSASTLDVDGENYYWFFDWGDGSNSAWIGPYGPNDEVTESHIWQNKGNYTVRVRYKQDGIMSAWATQKISSLKSKTYLFNIIENLIQRFPFFEKILKQIQ